MAKGQITTVILVLIVIGAVVYFALPTLENLPTGGTGGGGGPIQINNNIITVQSYSVSSLKMFPGDKTTISFQVQNNGDHEVDPVVNFYDYGGMGSPTLVCDFTPSTNNQCPFKLGPFQTGKVTLTLTAPQIGSITTFSISYSINYSYSGIRSATIPIIDGVTRTTPLGKFSQSQSLYAPTSAVPTYGPLQLSYVFPSTGTTEVNNQVITQSWGVNNMAFRLELQLSNVGLTSGAQPIKLYSMIISSSNNLQPSPSTPTGANQFCPLDDTVVSHLTSSQNTISSQLLTFNCEFVPNIGQGVPETTVQITATFSYVYTILRSETFTVQPFTQQS